VYNFAVLFLINVKNLMIKMIKTLNVLRLSKVSHQMYRASSCKVLKESNEISYSYKTHSCGELKISDIGKSVVLCGWIDRVHSNSFIMLRDYAGSTQVLLKHMMSNEFQRIKGLSQETVLCVKGKVVIRPKKQINSKLKTGEVEVLPDSVKVLNQCSHLPFLVNNSQNVSQEIRMKYRYIDLRNSTLQKNLRLRSKLIFKMRSFLEKNKFVDVETPTLCKSTPGGADEFVVPVSQGLKNKDLRQCYSLPQSPQLWKQFLMVGGLDKYYQVAKCYRDETLTVNRQLEFTQLDIEMSFVTQAGVMKLIEDMIGEVWPNPRLPFIKMTYSQAMRCYGCDKPDIRFQALLEDHGTVEELNYHAICFEDCSSSFHLIKEELLKNIKEMFSTLNSVAILKNKSTKVELIKLHDECCTFKGTKKLISKVNISEGEIKILCWDKDKDLCRIKIGRLRVLLASLLKKYTNNFKFSDKDAFLWVTDFPMFELNNSHQIKSVHHPFTAPHPEDQCKMFEYPLKTRSQAYDLVLNGEEVGGGSIRIHNAELQDKVLKNLLKINPLEFETLIEALKSGAPPHGGIALGLDRLISVLCKTDSIKDVIAFPKNASGKDVMVECPSKISDNDCKKYNIFR